MKLTKAQIAAIKSLEDRHGRVTPRQVVAAARRKDSPLHRLFNWNVRDAADKWWLHRARIILGAVQLQVTTTQHETRVPAYVVDMDAEGAGYRSVVALRQDSDSARDSLVYTLEVASGHLQRALVLSGPLGLAKEIDALITQVVGVQRIAKNGKKKAA